MTLTPEQKERHERIGEYGASPTLTKDLLSDVFAECETEGQMHLHNDAVRKIGELVVGGREDFLERVGQVMIEVARNEMMKESKSEKERT